MPDHAVLADVLIGRTWTEQSHIAYAKIGETLRIGLKEEEVFRDLVVDTPKKIELCAVKDVELAQRSINLVRTRPNRTIKDHVTILAVNQGNKQLHEV